MKYRYFCLVLVDEFVQANSPIYAVRRCAHDDNIAVSRQSDSPAVLIGLLTLIDRSSQWPPDIHFLVVLEYLGRATSGTTNSLRCEGDPVAVGIHRHLVQYVLAD